MYVGTTEEDPPTSGRYIQVTVRWRVSHFLSDPCWRCSKVHAKPTTISISEKGVRHGSRRKETL